MGKVLVSACLIGEDCKYNGGNNLSAAVMSFLRGKEYVAVCPELAAGMPVPRPAVEIVNGIVTDVHGKVVDAAYRQGVARIMAQICDEDISCAVLQSRSPTCGVHQVYDGSFTKTLRDGQGIFAAALAAKHIPLIDAEELEEGQL